MTRFGKRAHLYSFNFHLLIVFLPIVFLIQDKYVNIKFMLEAALMILIILFVLGYVNIPGVNIPNYHIYTLNKHVITLHELLIFIVIFWIIGFAPRFLRIIAGGLLIVWILSTLGIIMVKGLPVITLIAIIFVTFIHRSFHWYHHYRRRYY